MMLMRIMVLIVSVENRSNLLTLLGHFSQICDSKKKVEVEYQC